MATVTRVTLTCDLCGDAGDVTTWTFGLDGKAYEIDLCRKDGTALDRVAARYIPKARKVSARPGHRQARRQRRGRATGSKQKGIYVYGILPDDIEVTGDTPGVGEHPGLLRDIRFDGLAALVSDVDMSGPLGSPEDLRTHREILDATAAEVPVVPLPFGTMLASEDEVAQELLAARHDEFTAALERLEGRAEFQITGRYVKDAVAAWREQDTRALRDAMAGVCVASVAREPAGELDAVNVAFLVDINEERTVERVTQALAREWEGRIDLQLLGPMAAYDFTGPAQPES
jgi:hypothetical protein